MMGVLPLLEVHRGREGETAQEGVGVHAFLARLLQGGDFSGACGRS